MNSLSCPHCDARVPLQGTDEEWCEACGKKLPLAVVAAAHAAAKRLRRSAAATGEQQPGDAAPEAPAAPDRQPWSKTATRIAACLVYLLGATTFFSPFGWVTAVWLGQQKGTTLCAQPGCLRAADAPVTYTASSEPGGPAHVTVGYCHDHAGLAPKEIAPARGGRFKGLLDIAFILGPLVFAVGQFYCLVRVFQNRPAALLHLVVFTLIGVFLVNGVAFAYWIYF